MEKLYSLKELLKKGPTLGSTLTHSVTVGTQIAAPHKQQATVTAVQLRFH